MVALQLRITITPNADGSSNSLLEVDILSREDATQDEKDMAAAIEQLFWGASELVCQQTGSDLKVVYRV